LLRRGLAMSTWSRRDFVTLAVAAAGASRGPRADAVGPTTGLQAGEESLDAIARRKGIRFGSAMAHRQLSDPGYCGLMRTQCGIMVTENELKWPQVEPAADTFTFERGDALARFAADNQLLLRGHNLLWQKNKYLPDWVRNYPLGAHPRAALEKLLRDHITHEIKHYPQVVSWDVVNETVSTDTGEVRATIFTRHLGLEAIDLSYHAARALAPRAQLVYNDYMSWESTSEVHRNGVLRLLEGLRKRKVPVDALGLQSHLGAKDSRAQGTPQEAAWRGFLDEVTGMGYGLLITEFDVNDGGLPTDPARRDRMLADYGRRYLDITLSYPQLRHVLTWGLVDKDSWLQHLTPRADSTPRRPLPFDSDYRPKPLHLAMAEAFRAAPMR
ncbi:MAG: endo-1,4-beta-xylanase, partial [Steroidobacteraceae bacterium]